MSGRLLSVFDRRSRLARRLTVAAVGLLALGVVATVLTPAPGLKHRTGPHTPRWVLPAQTPVSRRHAPFVSAGEFAHARNVAARFLSGYLPFLYGRGSARSVDAAARGLRRQLMRSRAEATPAEHGRHPHVVSLAVVAQASGVVLATALVEDGGITAYSLRITLQEARSGWLASAVDGR
jgi:hypothetical protein